MKNAQWRTNVREKDYSLIIRYFASLSLLAQAPAVLPRRQRRFGAITDAAENSRRRKGCPSYSDPDGALTVRYPISREDAKKGMSIATFATDRIKNISQSISSGL